MSIGKTLLQLRTKKGISQEKLAEDLGITRQTISKWESDLSLPNMEMMFRLSEYYQVNVTEILGLEAEVNDTEKIYEQISRVTEKIEQNESKRKTRDYILLGIIVALLLIIISLCFKLNSKEQIIYINQPQTSPIQDLIYTIAKNDIIEYDLDQQKILLDYEIRLKKYDEETTIQLVFDSIQYPLENKGNGLYVFNDYIPLNDYQESYYIFSYKDGSKETTEAHQEDFLTRLLMKQIQVFFDYDEDFRMDGSHLSYKSNNEYLNAEIKTKIKGKLPGELAIHLEYKDIKNQEISYDTKVPYNQDIKIDLPSEVKFQNNCTYHLQYINNNRTIEIAYETKKLLVNANIITQIYLYNNEY